MYTVRVGVQCLPENSTHLLLICVMIHEDFNNLISHDIALPKLRELIPSFPLIQPVCLPNARFKPSIRTTCWVMGWGHTDCQGESRQAEVPRHLSLQNTASPCPP